MNETLAFGKSQRVTVTWHERIENGTRQKRVIGYLWDASTGSDTLPLAVSELMFDVIETHVDNVQVDVALSASDGRIVQALFTATKTNGLLRLVPSPDVTVGDAMFAANWLSAIGLIGFDRDKSGNLLLREGKIV